MDKRNMMLRIEGRMQVEIPKKKCAIKQTAKIKRGEDEDEVENG